MEATQAVKTESGEVTIAFREYGPGCGFFVSIYDTKPYGSLRFSFGMRSPEDLRTALRGLLEQLDAQLPAPEPGILETPMFLCS